MSPLVHRVITCGLILLNCYVAQTTHWTSDGRGSLKPMFQSLQFEQSQKFKVGPFAPCCQTQRFSAHIFRETHRTKIIGKKNGRPDDHLRCQLVPLPWRWGSADQTGWRFVPRIIIQTTTGWWFLTIFNICSQMF